MLYQLIYRPTNVSFISVRHGEVVPAAISTSTPAHLVELTHVENSRVPLYSGFLRRIFPMPRCSWVGMKAGARTLEPEGGTKSCWCQFRSYPLCFVAIACFPPYLNTIAQCFWHVMNLQLLTKPSSGSVRIGSTVEVVHISISRLGLHQVCKRKQIPGCGPWRMWRRSRRHKRRAGLLRAPWCGTGLGERRIHISVTGALRGC